MHDILHGELMKTSKTQPNGTEIFFVSREGEVPGGVNWDVSSSVPSKGHSCQQLGRKCRKFSLVYAKPYLDFFNF